VPPTAWALIELTAVIAGVVVLGLVAEAIAVSWRGRSGRPPAHDPPGARQLLSRVLVAYAALSTGAVAVAIARNGAVYDRYLWPVVLCGAVLLVSAFPVVPLSRWHPAASQLALAVVMAVAAVSLLVTLNSDAFDGARWRLASQAANGGVPASSVDGGFEWVGWHATSVADANAVGDATRTYWLAMVGEGAACAEVSASPLRDPGLVLVRTLKWRPWLLFGRARLYEYRRPGACT
jgi:hypothetical protein